MGNAKVSRSILAALPTDLSTRLCAGASPHGVGAGEPLFHAGDPPDGCYRLETGLLKFSVDSQDGERLVIGFLGEGATVGALAMIDGLPRSATAHAVKDTLLSFITAILLMNASRRILRSISIWWNVLRQDCAKQMTRSLPQTFSIPRPDWPARCSSSPICSGSIKVTGAF